MAEVKPGLYTVQDLLDLADFDAQKEAAADYNESGYDLRRVQVGGLPFHSFDEAIRVPDSAETVEITLDSEVVATLDVVSEDE